jgi:hypothetical protein
VTPHHRSLKTGAQPRGLGRCSAKRWGGGAQGDREGVARGRGEVRHDALDQGFGALAQVVADDATLEEVARQRRHQGRIGRHDGAGFEVDLEHHAGELVALVHDRALGRLGVPGHENRLQRRHVSPTLPAPETCAPRSDAMATAPSIRPIREVSPAERQTRQDLAALYRIVVPSSA